MEVPQFWTQFDQNTKSVLLSSNIHRDNHIEQKLAHQEYNFYTLIEQRNINFLYTYTT